MSFFVKGAKGHDIPVQITVRGFEHTPAIEERILKEAAKLAGYFDGIVTIRAVAESPPKHHKKGRVYDVHLFVAVPGKEIAVKWEPQTDLYLAVRDAFLAARRQVKAYVERQRGLVKTHEKPAS